MENKNFYDILGLSPHASKEDIKAGFQEFIKGTSEKRRMRVREGVKKTKKASVKRRLKQARENIFQGRKRMKPLKKARFLNLKPLKRRKTECSTKKDRLKPAKRAPL